MHAARNSVKENEPECARKAFAAHLFIPVGIFRPSSAATAAVHQRESENLSG